MNWNQIEYKLRKKKDLFRLLLKMLLDEFYLDII